MTLTIAPQSALCAECGCSAHGDVVRVVREYDRLIGRYVPTYRHVDTTGCLLARQRSEAFWYGNVATLNTAAD